ncbi:MAG: type VI secretion system tube protein Hcp [Armatimonadetes bacterium]|nr:type VI secretion system tube protein Hcp [Armatimonadota bacterium]
MAYEFYLKIDGIDGESRDEDHKGWIEILSFSWGVSNAIDATGGARGGRGAGRANFSDLNVMKFLDKSTPKLLLSVASGKHFKFAELHLSNQPLETEFGASNMESDVFTFLKLEDVLVSSHQVSGSAGGGNAPTEAFSLNFGKVTLSVASINRDKADPPETVTWDLKQNKKV